MVIISFCHYAVFTFLKRAATVLIEKYAPIYMGVILQKKKVLPDTLIVESIS